MEKEKKSKMINVSLWILLAVVILFVIVSSSLIKSKEDYLNDLTQKNEEIEDKLNEEQAQELKI
ncbi:MAG: hypothetical protein E7379_00175 [Clostridiales bacterium]|nr:hypothetical protein [Clostridiales bacterium]